MPNWTFNTVSTDSKTMAKIKTECTVDGKFDFNALIPMPEELNIEASMFNDEAIYVFLSERLTKPQIEVIDHPYYKRPERRRVDELVETEAVKKAKRRTPKELDEMYKLGMALVNNYQNYGATTWYDWRHVNWGTRTNAEDSDFCGDENLFFVTAWNAPLAVFRVLSGKYPKAEFACVSEYEEGITAKAIYKHGKEIFYEEREH